MAGDGLPEAQRRFVGEFLKDLDATAATNVTLHNLAVSDGGSGDVVLLYDEESGGVAAARALLGPQRVAVVRSEPLDVLFPEGEIVLLKADVDGYELDVLRGGRALIARSRPDVLFEYRPFAMEVRGVGPGDIPELLTGLGVGTFSLYASDGTFLETTTDPARVWAAFQSLRRPLDHLDVHAYPTG